ncbi:MAG: DNA repair protein RecO [Pseudomonadota bacterium]
MEFSDQGVVLHARAHGETHAIVDVFTENHGRWSALIYGGQGRKMQPILQPGNGARVNWRGRNEDSLGHFSIELAAARTGALMQDRASLGALAALCATLRAAAPEREAHPSLYTATVMLLDALDDIDLWPALFARWEVGLLRELGFGLTLDKCAATGNNDHLAYVSPRSAQAVSASAGEPYKDKLLPLPGFLVSGAAFVSIDDAIDALTMTGYFIETRILHQTNEDLPEARRGLLSLLENLKPAL